MAVLNIYVCYVEKLIWHAPSLPPWKVSTCKATSLVVVVHSTNEVSAWLWCSVYLNISYCFYWQTQHMVWIFSIILFIFFASGAPKFIAKRVRIVLTCYQKQCILFHRLKAQWSITIHACLLAIEWDVPHIHEHSRILHSIAYQLLLHSRRSL